MEKFDRIIDVGKGRLSFIYFLIGIDEVVYVGQTRIGLSRPMQHHNVKGFNKIGIIDCKPEHLNKTVAELIQNKLVVKCDGEILERSEI